MESGLAHQSQKAGGLQGYRFTAGIRTGDDEQIIVLSQTDGDRDHLLRIQQRVTAFLNIDLPFFVEAGAGGLHIFSQLGFGENEVEGGQDIVVLVQLLSTERGLVA